MPRSGQIIPEWLHPHEMVVINDNTRYEDYTNPNSGPAFLNVFMSGKGVDNKLKYFDDITAWVNEYGLPNYRLYGQPGYNAYVSLSTGLATSQSMRIMPPNADYANIVLMCYYQKVNGKLKLKFTTETGVENLSDIDTLQGFVDRMGSNAADEEGYKKLPILSFWSRGRGEYGNNYRVRISRDKGSDRENDYVNYVIELLTTEDGVLKVLEAYNVSFFIDAINPNSELTLFVNDIIDDENGVGSARFNCSLEYDNLQKIFDEYSDVFANNAPLIYDEKEVAALPATSAISSATIYIVEDTKECWVYNSTLGTFIVYEQYEHLVDTTEMPTIYTELTPDLTLEHAENGLYVVAPQGDYTSVLKYNATTKDYEPESYIDFFDMDNKSYTDEELTKLDNNDLVLEGGKYYVDYNHEKIQVAATVVENVAVPLYIYRVTEDSSVEYYLLNNKTTITNVTNRIYDLATEDELPANTDLVEEDTVYTLTADDNGKAAGTKWIFDSSTGEYKEFTPTEDDYETNPYTMATFDIFGYNKFTEDADDLIEIEGGTESIDILAVEGAGLAFGTDGSFSVDTEESVREEAIEVAYLAAFNGEFDKTIKSKRRAPVDLILDANYPVSVKKAMVALTLQRGDAALHLDTMLTNTVEDLEVFYTNHGFANLRDRLVSFDAHMFKTSDPITGKVIPVTITLWLAQKYPMHYYVYGNHTPLAGEEYATLSGYTKNSIRPVIDIDDEETKELLYTKLGMNYIECIAENTYMRGTQQTSQNYMSDLWEENNMLVLLEIKRKIERLAAKNRYKWTDPDQLDLFKKACREVFSSYEGTKVSTLDIDVDMNAWEKTRYILHVYLAVVFRTFQKRAIIEIDVNPRA